MDGFPLAGYDWFHRIDWTVASQSVYWVHTKTRNKGKCSTYFACTQIYIYILLFAALPLFTLCETLYLGISMRSYCESTIPLMNSTLFHSKRIWSSAYASEEGKMPAQPTDHRGKATLINPFDQRFSDRRFGKYKSQRKIQTYSCQTKEDMIGDPWESFLVSWDILL